MQNPILNSVLIPSGLPHSPLFASHNLPLPILYGSLAPFLSRTMTLGFTTHGRHFDINGKISDWWSNTTRSSHASASRCFIDQYSNYSVPLPSFTTVPSPSRRTRLKMKEPKIKLPSVPVDGERTLEHNMADHGDLQISHNSWKIVESVNGDAGEIIEKLPGFERFSGDQMFFITYVFLFPSFTKLSILISKFLTRYAASMCSVVNKPEILLDLIMRGDIPPNDIRVRGSLSNSPQFSKAFRCKPKTSMNPIDKCQIF